MDTVTNGSIITGALDYLNGKIEKLDGAPESSASSTEQIEDGNNMLPNGEANTTNDVS